MDSRVCVISPFSFTMKLGRGIEDDRMQFIPSVVLISASIGHERSQRETEREREGGGGNNIRLARCVATTGTNFVQSGYGN